MRRRLAHHPGLILTALTAVLLASATPAHAAPVNCQAPPGTSAIDQYCETVPGAGGDQGTGRGDDRGGSGNGRTGNGGTVGDSVPRRTRGALRDAGPAGERILNLPTATSGPGADAGTQAAGSSRPAGSAEPRGGGANGTTDPQRGDTSVPADTSDNPLDAVWSAASTGSSAGPGFIWILILIGVVMAAFAWLRYRRTPSG